MKTIELKNRVEWRAWLIENHDREKEIWLIYYKKVTGIPSIEYGESLDEALCFGWVDCLIKKIDEQRCARKFTPRAEENFNSLAASYQKQYLAWIITAKRAETKKRRIEESIQLLIEGKKLGLR